MKDLELWFKSTVRLVWSHILQSSTLVVKSQMEAVCIQTGQLTSFNFKRMFTTVFSKFALKNLSAELSKLGVIQINILGSNLLKMVYLSIQIIYQKALTTKCTKRSQTSTDPHLPSPQENHFSMTRIQKDVPWQALLWFLLKGIS